MELLPSDERRNIVQVVGHFPSHSTNLKYHRHPLPLDTMDKNTSSNFDTPAWSTLIDEAATEQSSYQNVRRIGGLSNHRIRCFSRVMTNDRTRLKRRKFVLMI